VKRILVVDDEVQIRSLLRQMLEAEGYQVLTAADGEEAMGMVHAHTLDLVITDMIMPGKDGLKLIMELQREYPELPVIAISGGGAIRAEQYLSMVSYLGDIATMEKPFERRRLLRLVHQRIHDSGQG